MIIYHGIEVRTIPELLALLANTEPEPKNESPRADQNGNTPKKAEKEPEK